MSRAAVAVLTRVLLVIFTFVLIVVLAQIALVAARTRFEHAPLGDVLLQAWDVTQDQRLKSAAERLGYDLDYSSGSSDHFAFLRRRVPAVIISGTEVGPFDTVGAPATLDRARLRASGEVVLQSVLEMAATD